MPHVPEQEIPLLGPVEPKIHSHWEKTHNHSRHEQHPGTDMEENDNMRWTADKICYATTFRRQNEWILGWNSLKATIVATWKIFEGWQLLGSCLTAAWSVLARLGTTPAVGNKQRRNFPRTEAGEPQLGPLDEGRSISHKSLQTTFRCSLEYPRQSQL
jgi:hypothetical protein